MRSGLTPPGSSFGLATLPIKGRDEVNIRAAALRLHLERFDLDILLWTDEAEALLVRDLEQSAHAAQARDGNGE